jgi:hypothetical protein
MEDVRFSNITMTTAPKWGQGLEWPIVVDTEKRTNESRLSHVRDVSFSDIMIYTKGRVMVGGQPDSALENVTLRNITMRVGGFEQIKAAKKMRGGSNTVAENTVDYAATPAAFIFNHVHGLALDGVTILWPDVTKEPAPERRAIHGDRLEDVRVTALRGEASVPSMKAVVFENSTRVQP